MAAATISPLFLTCLWSHATGNLLLALLLGGIAGLSLRSVAGSLLFSGLALSNYFSGLLVTTGGNEEGTRQGAPEPGHGKVDAVAGAVDEVERHAGEGQALGSHEACAASAAVEAVAASGSTAECALAALELLCTVAGGAAAVRREALAAPVLARAVEGMAGRGRECAIGVLAAIYGGNGGGDESAGTSPPPPEVVKAVVGAMQGECSARGRHKGAQLLRALQEGGRLGLAWDGVGGS